MEHFKQIDRVDVWPHLQAGKNVLAAVFKSRVWNVGIVKLTKQDVGDVNQILTEKDVVFYEEIKEG